MSPRILLIHGYISNPPAWEPLQRELNGEVETIATCLPGYGNTADPQEYTLDGIAEALEETLDVAQPDYLLGHSMGALVALELAHRYPERFKRIGLVGLPVFESIDEGLRFIGDRSTLRGWWIRNFDKGHIICGPGNFLRYLWAPVVNRMFPSHPLPMLLQMFNHTSDAHRGGIEEIVFAGQARRLALGVATPVVLLHGDLDGVTPLDSATKLAREQNWDLRVANGSGHSITYTEPEAVAQWVRERLLLTVDGAEVPEMDHLVGAGSD
tara:strand:+ start:3911 stop:4714 length:804 start_codon:yes stop_codon:yes gene_type:complete